MTVYFFFSIRKSGYQAGYIRQDFGCRKWEGAYKVNMLEWLVRFHILQENSRERNCEKYVGRQAVQCLVMLFSRRRWAELLQGV